MISVTNDTGKVGDMLIKEKFMGLTIRFGSKSQMFPGTNSGQIYRRNTLAIEQLDDMPSIGFQCNSGHRMSSKSDQNSAAF